MPRARCHHVQRCHQGTQEGQAAYKAMELLAEVQQKGLASKAITYNTAISAWEKAKQRRKAMELLAEMRLESLAPIAITCSSAVSASKKPSSFTR